MNVEEMGFSTRTQNALKRNGIHRMEQLQGLGLSELLSCGGLASGQQRRSKGRAAPYPASQRNRSFPNFWP